MDKCPQITSELSELLYEYMKKIPFAIRIKMPRDRRVVPEKTASEAVYGQVSTNCLRGVFYIF